MATPSKASARVVLKNAPLVGGNLHVSVCPVCRLDRQTQATTLVHQIFGGYLRSRGTDLPVPVAQKMDYNPAEQP